MLIKRYLFLLFCSFIFTSQILSQENIIHLASSEYPPYFGEKLDNNGVISEIIVKSFNRVGYDVEITFMPWARAFEMTKRGDFDGMFALWHRKDREKWFLFSEPLLPKNEIGFYKRKENNITYKRLEDLKEYYIGVCRQYANPPEFEQATFLKIEEVVNDKQNILKLYHKRVDLILIDKGLAQYLITTQFPKYQEELEWMEPVLETVEQHLVISKDANVYLIKIFNEGLRVIKEEGTIQRILRKHEFK